MVNTSSPNNLWSTLCLSPITVLCSVLLIRLLIVVNYAIKCKIMHNVLTAETKVKTVNSNSNNKWLTCTCMCVRVCVYVCMSFPFPGLKMAGGNKSDNGQPRRHCSCQLPENGKYYASVLLRQAHALALALTLARTSQPGHCSAVLPASGSSSLTPTHTCAGVCAFVLKVSVCLAA